MEFCGWKYVGFFDWVASYNPEVQAAWVSAIGTMLAAFIALFVYIASECSQKRQRTRVAKEASDAKDARWRAILETAFEEFATMIGRVADAVNACDHFADEVILESPASFKATSFSPEYQSLSEMRELFMELPKGPRTDAFRLMGRLARYNAYVVAFDVWAAGDNFLLYIDTRRLHLLRVQDEAKLLVTEVMQFGQRMGRVLNKPNEEIEMHFGAYRSVVESWSAGSGTPADDSPKPSQPLAERA